MTTTSIIDACAIATATAVAACGAVGISPFGETFPLEQVGIVADLAAGGFAGRHALTHWRHSRHERLLARQRAAELVGAEFTE